MLKKIILSVTALAATATIATTEANAGHRHRGYDAYYGGGYYDPYYDGRRHYRGDPYYGRGYAYDRRHYRRGHHYGYDRRHYRRGYDYGYHPGYYRRRCGSGTTGAIIGGAAGALLGREIGRGGRRDYYYGYRRGGSGTTGAIIGGAAGALLGREIGRSC